MPVTPSITIARKSGAAAAFKRLAGITKLAAYVGVPASGATARTAQLLEMAGKVRGKKKLARLKKAATQDVTNAELLFIHTKGSPLKHIPARPVIEPAIENEANKKIISRELAASVKASLDGNHDLAVKKMKRAAMAGQNAARGWFTSPDNHWPKLADSTKRARMRNITKAQLAQVFEAGDAAHMRNMTKAQLAAEVGDAAFTPLIDTGALRASIVGIIKEE